MRPWRARNAPAGSTSRRFALYGVPWRLQVWPLPAVLAQERTVLPAVVLGGGSLLTVLLALVLGLAQRTRTLNQELEQRVQARTAALAVAEAAERAQRERWQTTLASIGDAVIVTDTAGRVSFLNAVAHTLTGWAPDEATGQPLPQIFRIVNERDAPTSREPGDARHPRGRHRRPREPYAAARERRPGDAD